MPVTNRSPPDRDRAGRVAAARGHVARDHRRPRHADVAGQRGRVDGGGVAGVGGIDGAAAAGDVDDVESKDTSPWETR